MTALDIKAINHYHFEARNAAGELLWDETVKNLVTNVGLNEILDKFWKGASYTAAHFVGISDDAPTFAAGDTMASHAGWAEVDDYSESTRPALTLGTVSGQSVDNIANRATYTFDADGVNVGGAFIVTNSTKGGTTGILIGGAPLSQDRVLNTGDTLSITVTLTMASA